MDPLLEGEELFSRKSIKRAKRGFKSRFKVNRVVVLPVRRLFICRGHFNQWYTVVILIGYQSPDLFILKIGWWFVVGFFYCLKEFVNCNATREFVVFGS